jgi:hypothetical protein
LPAAAAADALPFCHFDTIHQQEYRQRRAAQERDKQAAATADFYSLFDGGLSMGELPPGIDIDKLDTLLQQLGPELAQELGLR